MRKEEMKIIVCLVQIKAIYIECTAGVNEIENLVEFVVKYIFKNK